MTAQYNIFRIQYESYNITTKLVIDQILTRICLADTFLHAPLVSDELYQLILGAKIQGEKIGLLYNRRGSGRAWICQDCGYFPLCPHCNIALAYHTSPKKNLLCHQCNFVERVIGECRDCHGQRFDAVGMGIQKVETDIGGLFPDRRLLRVDSDAHEKREKIIHTLHNIDILLGTYNSLGLMSQMDHIVFVLFESDLTIPEYRMEEEVFHALDYAKKLGKNILIQTRMREHPLLDLIMEGNYKDFLKYMSHEREIFQYPPYTQFVMIRIHDRSQARVTDIITKLANKIEQLKNDTTFFAYDRDIWEKSGGEWIQKIVLKEKNLSPILHAIQTEILRNRSVTLEWR